MFERFWRAYPRKVGKPAARRAWNGAMRKKVDLLEMSAGLWAWKAYWDYRQDPQFIPHPSTWLNQERWNDEPPPIRSHNKGIAVLSDVLKANGIRLGR